MTSPDHKPAMAVRAMPGGPDAPATATPAAAAAIQGASAGFQITPRTVKMLAYSSLMPEDYAGDEGAAMMFLDMANRTGLPLITLVQNLHVIRRRLAWGSSFLIGAVNATRRFSPLRFREHGSKGKADWGFHCEAVALEDGEVLKGEVVDMAMAKAEKWTDKKGSKYRTMPGQMLRYRAAAFWARIYAPEVAFGLLTRDEVRTIQEPAPSRAERLGRAITGKTEAVDEAAPIQEAEVVDEEPAEAAPDAPGAARTGNGDNGAANGGNGQQDAPEARQGQPTATPTQSHVNTRMAEMKARRPPPSDADWQSFDAWAGAAGFTYQPDVDRYVPTAEASRGNGW